MKIADVGKARTMQLVPMFRLVVPESTTTHAPRLQQAWQDMSTGELEWTMVPTVVVSDEEFRRG